MKRALAIASVLFAACLCSAWTARTTIPAARVATQTAAPSGDPWTPAEFGSDLVTWVRSSDTQLMAMAISDVDRWTNTAPVSAVAVAPTSARRPALVADSINGYPAVVFDGSIDYMNHSQLSALRNAPGFASAWLVRPKSVPSAGQYVSYFSTVTGGSTRWQFGFTSGQCLSAQARRADADGVASQVSPALAAVASNQWIFASAWVGFSTRALTMTCNGSAATNAANWTSAGSMSEDTDTTTARISSPAYFGGDVVEVIDVRRAFTTDEAQKWDGYIAHRYGLTALLPADHPYKSAAPTK